MDGWKQTLSLLIEKGELCVNYNKEFFQILNLNLEISNAEEDIIRPIQFLSESEKWIYPDMEEIKSIIMTKQKNPAYSYTYGQRIFNFYDQQDQIDNYIIPLLKKNKLSRKGIVSLWNPMIDSDLESKNKPGLVMCTFKIIDKKLNVTTIIRNSDIYMGWPANLYQAYVIQDYVAEAINVEKGKLIFYMTTCHIYKEHMDEIRKLIKRNFE